MPRQPFVEALVAARGPVADAAALAAAFADRAAAARAAWPEVALDDATFAAWLVARLPPDDPPLAALTALHTSDLFLACACAGGDARALAAFERGFLDEVAAYLSRADALSGFTDEVKQALRQRLFVAEGGVVPRIASYSGRGPLGGWLRMAVTRAAIDLRRRAQAGPAVAELPELPAAGHDPELRFLKEHYRRELAEAMRETLAALSDRESNVLWLHYYEGLSTEAIGATYRVSARTVQRWLEAAREQILDATHARLAARLRVDESEVRQLVELARSQLDVSIHRYLKPR